MAIEHKETTNADKPVWHGTKREGGSFSVKLYTGGTSKRQYHISNRS